MRLVVLVCLASVAAAQPPTPIMPESPDPVGVRQTASAERSFALATTLLSNGRIDEATAMLEDLYIQRPDAVAVWLQLRDAYTAGRRYDDVVRITDERVAREGPTVILLAERGLALARADRTDAALASWQDAVNVAPSEEQTYRTVANAMASLRMYDEAVAVFDDGLRRLDDPALFRLERARLYGLALDYSSSVDLYLDLVADEPDYRPSVQALLTRMLAGTGAAEIFQAAIDRAAALDPLSRSLRELQSWLALERGDYNAALDAVRALDRLEREQGETLLAFAVQAQSADAPEAAARALDEVLERHADGPAAPTALWMRAGLWDAAARDARERADAGPTPSADSARHAYRLFLDQHPAEAVAPRAALAFADLLRDVYRDFDGSEEYLSLAASGRDAGIAATARLGLGDVAIRRGDLDAARARFGDVDESVRIGPLAEQARYELALVDFYEGLMFSALARAEALDENTAADAANDAIGLRVTLNEILDPEAEPGADPSQDALYLYAQAALAHRQQDTERALATLDSLDAVGVAALADQSLFLRASTLLAVGDAGDAVAVLDRLGAEHPDSFFLDRAYRLQAQAYERDLGDASAAAERYDRLLERFPGSPLAPEARAELRRLRTPS